MSLFALIVVLTLGIVSIAALIYRWLIAGQRHQTYGTIVVPRKAGNPSDSAVRRAVAAITAAIVGLTRPINWRGVFGQMGLTSLSASNTRPAGRS